jgi:hypothetical protein
VPYEFRDYVYLTEVAALRAMFSCLVCGLAISPSSARQIISLLSGVALSSLVLDQIILRCRSDLYTARPRSRRGFLHWITLRLINEQRRNLMPDQLNEDASITYTDIAVMSQEPGHTSL